MNEPCFAIVTVGELIEALKGFDPEDSVLIAKKHEYTGEVVSRDRIQSLMLEGFIEFGREERAVVIE